MKVSSFQSPVSGCRKGQYFSFDAIVAAVIFVLTMVMLLSYWHSVRTYLDYQASDLNSEATRISNLLFGPPLYSQPGAPCDNINRLGLALSYNDKRIDERLLLCPALADESALKSGLGAAYNVSVVVTDTYDTSKQPYKLGTPPDNFPSDLKEVAKMSRIATLHTVLGQDHMATIDVYVYR